MLPGVQHQLHAAQHIQRVAFHLQAVLLVMLLPLLQQCLSVKQNTCSQGDASTHTSMFTRLNMWAVKDTGVYYRQPKAIHYGQSHAWRHLPSEVKDYTVWIVPHTGIYPSEHFWVVVDIGVCRGKSKTPVICKDMYLSEHFWVVVDTGGATRLSCTWVFTCLNISG